MVVDPNKKYTVDDKEYWERLYQVGRTPWELNTFAPPLKTFLDSPYKVEPGKIAVVGCGTGHNCMLFAERGFEVTGIDFAPHAIKETHEKFVEAGISGTTGYLLERDLFDIHEYDSYFDYILDHACFCSILPSRRKQYALTMRDLLKPEGKMIALFWILERKGAGPPYATSKDDVFEIFKDIFSLDIVFEPTDSVPERQGKELFCLMSPKPPS